MVSNKLVIKLIVGGFLLRPLDTMLGFFLQYLLWSPPGDQRILCGIQGSYYEEKLTSAF